MTISNTTTKNVYSGNGVATVFAFTFPIAAETELEVYLLESGFLTLKTLNTDYTIAGVGNPSGGSVTFVTPPPTVTGGSDIVLVRKTPLTQLADYIEGDSFPAETHEAALDKLTKIAQEHAEALDRAAQLPVNSSEDVDTLTQAVLLVANNNTNINTVATNIANVNIVATNIADVNAVAANETNITAVAANEANINAAVANEANINAAVANETNITAVAANETNITAVAANEANINAAVANETNITAVAANETNISAVAANETNVNAAVANEANINAAVANETNITAVAANETNINAAVANEPNINAVAANETSITAIAANETNIIAVAANETNINAVAANEANINAAVADLPSLSAKVSKAGDAMTGLLNLAAGANIASASTVNLTAATGNCPKITGTTAVTAWTMNTGQQMKCIAGGALPLTYHATTNNIEGGTSYTCAAGDIINLVKGLDGVVRVRIEKAAGGLRLINRRVITASELGKAYTAGAKKAKVVIIGGGGGGGGTDGQGAGTNATSVAGAGGAYCEKYFTITASTYTVTIGAGGAGGAAGNNDGANGGTTSFTDSVNTLTANGGSGGGGHTGATTNQSASGGSLGGSASGGDINLSGGCGTAKSVSNTGPGVPSSSVSGAAPFFGGGVYVGWNTNGINATNFGEGGGSCASIDTTANRTGGAGFQGVCILEEYA